MSVAEEKLKQEIEIVKSRMQDDRSRDIFQVRCDAVFRNMLYDSVMEMNRLVDKFDYVLTADGTVLTALPDRDVIVFGSGHRGKLNARILEKAGFRVIAFSDNAASRHGKTIEGKKVISPQELVGRADTIIVVSVEYAAFAIRQQLIGMGIADERIILAPDMRADNYDQYFDVFSPGADEIFVDAGCFRGESSVRFIKWCDGIYRHIYAFEPDAGNYRYCKEVFAGEQRVILQNRGLYDSEGTLSFSADGSGESRIMEDETGDKIEETRLDHVLQGDPVTLIKMDIEGAEEKAILGAQETIRRHRPRLAISVYHKMTDILDLPMLLLDYVPEYRFWLRHYTASLNDTVLYASV